MPEPPAGTMASTPWGRDITGPIKRSIGSGLRKNTGAGTTSQANGCERYHKYRLHYDIL